MDHLIDQCLKERGGVIVILAAGNAETIVEAKALEQLVSEVVHQLYVDHVEVVDRFVSYCELHHGSQLPQAEKGRHELVSDKVLSIGFQVLWVDGKPLFTEDSTLIHVSNLEPDKVESYIIKG